MANNKKGGIKKHLFITLPLTHQATFSVYRRFVQRRAESFKSKIRLEAEHGFV
jgi:hypothetical protein